MTNEPDPLALAILRLARPFKVPTLQGEGEEQWLTVVVHPPLLTQLRGAVVGGTGPHAGSGTSDPRARLPFDPGAQALYDNIERIVTTWYVKAGLPAVGYGLEGMVEEWARAYRAEETAGRLPEGSYVRRAARVEAWCEAIEALFDPPVLVPIDAPCPVCSRERVVNANEEHVYALVVEYWKVGERVTRSNARCRAADCATVWHGLEGVAALMALLDAQPEPEPEHALVEAVGDPVTSSIPVVTAPLPVRESSEDAPEQPETQPDAPEAASGAAEADSEPDLFDRLLSGEVGE